MNKLETDRIIHFDRISKSVVVRDVIGRKVKCFKLPLEIHDMSP
jgi:hypothetical protein